MKAYPGHPQNDRADLWFLDRELPDEPIEQFVVFPDQIQGSEDESGIGPLARENLTWRVLADIELASEGDERPVGKNLVERHPQVSNKVFVELHCGLCL